MAGLKIHRCHDAARASVGREAILIDGDHETVRFIVVLTSAVKSDEITS